MTDPTDLTTEAAMDETVLIPTKSGSDKKYHRTLDGENPVCKTGGHRENTWRDVDLVVLRGHYDHCEKCKAFIEGTWADQCRRVQNGR